MEPVNVSPVMTIFLSTLPRIQTALADKELTVSEAIDIVSALAHATARELGVADKVIAVTD